MSSTRNSDVLRDAPGIIFDTQTKTVMTSMPRGSQGKIKEKIASVREVVPHRSNNEITIVLEHFEYNVPEAIAAFLEDGAASVLKQWNCSGSNKLNKKGKNKKNAKAPQSPAPPPSASESNGTGPAPKAQANSQTNNVRKTDRPSSGAQVNGILNDLADVKVDNGLQKVPMDRNVAKPLTHSSSTVSDSVSSVSSRQNSVSEKPDQRLLSGRKSLEKPIKDLNRHSVSMLRLSVLLSEEFHRSQKRLKESFQDLRKILQEREAHLAKELNEAKEQANTLLEGRISQANKMKASCECADAMNSIELNELRIDLKHFISERKFDEDLGKTVRFVRDHDRLVNEIRGYGEVVPAKNLYTRRRQSASSIHSEPVGIVLPTALPASKPPCIVPATKAVSNDAAATSPASAMSAAELSELRQKLQNSLRSQGLSVDSPSSNRSIRTGGGGGGSGSGAASLDNRQRAANHRLNTRQKPNPNKPSVNLNGRAKPANSTNSK